MRYFVITADDRIVTATDVCSGSFYDGTHFTVGNDRFKYDPYCQMEEIERIGYRYPFHKVCFYKRAYDDWNATSEIKYLIVLNEEENLDMKYFQSTDFNAGVIYAKLDRSMGDMLIGDKTKFIIKEIHLPEIQLLPKCFGMVQEAKILDATKTAVLAHFTAVYGERFDIDLGYRQDPSRKQYIVFEARITRKETTKEMTVAEIEKALGYKIKVVSDK